jgi:branched-chain amino acid aminotransferase
VSDLQLWRITANQTLKLDTGASTPDDVTRQLPDGYYSTFRTFDGCTRVLGLSAHLRRLYEPVSSPEVEESVLRRELRALLEPYQPGEARLRAVMTDAGQVYIAIAPLIPLSRSIYENGVHAQTTELQRQHPRLKSTSFIGRSDAERKHIAREGIFEALLVKDGEILEGMTSNFFYIASDRAQQGTAEPRREAILCTANEDILLGVTRETIIHVAQGMGLDVKYQPLKRDRLEVAGEAFITSSSRGVVPVIQIDGVPIGQGKPGLITQQLAAAYEAYVVAEAERIF